MKILIVRHAKAKDKKKFALRGLPDEERPLTREGKSEMLAAALGLKSEIPALDHIVTSPLVRARQTAAILNRVYPRAHMTEHAGLAPRADTTILLKWLRSKRRNDVVALVGHEPDLGRLMSFLLTGNKKSFVELKKGSAGLLDFSSSVKPGAGNLLWMLKPSHLRQLRK